MWPSLARKESEEKAFFSWSYFPFTPWIKNKKKKKNEKEKLGAYGNKEKRGKTWAGSQ